jgi:transposase
MRDKELYGVILGITAPWRVAEVELSVGSEEVRVTLEHDGSALICPSCGRASPKHDSRRREWRHLDTCQFRTVIVTDVPRVDCSEHGVHQVKVPWAEAGSRFTAMFESLAIDWLKEASTRAVARRLRMSWDEVDGVMQRAVRRGLARRSDEPLTQIGIDETSFQRRHEYVTVVTDIARARVVYVADGRGRDAIEGFFDHLGVEGSAALQVVAMDMWKPYIDVTTERVAFADYKIAFDRFHVAKHINEAVDAVRRQESRALHAEGDDRLRRTKYLWLMSPDRRTSLEPERGAAFDALKHSSLKVARAWAIKETARSLWDYSTRGWAARAWQKWVGWAKRSRLEPIKKIGRMVQSHLTGILNAVALGATNAIAESLNARIQKVKARACGFRNRERFRNAIYFHCGDLQLYPGIPRLTHTTS